MDLPPVSVEVQCEGEGKVVYTNNNDQGGRPLRFQTWSLYSRSSNLTASIPVINMEIRLLLLALSSVMAVLRATDAFVAVPSQPVQRSTSLLSSPVSTSGVELTRSPDKKPSSDWELDCYSRPVVTVGGKKLWEVLITDSTGSFRYLKTLPSNQVNSKELRATVEDLLEQSDVKPSTIRYFRGAMFNMIKIALSELDVVGRPSRCTYSVAQWLEERHRKIYPKMEG